MTPQVLLLENLDNFTRLSKIPVWVNIDDTDNYHPGFLIDILGDNPVIGHIVIKEGSECFRHIWVPLKTHEQDYTKIVSRNELQQISKL
jgi:hypothetical protein